MTDDSIDSQRQVSPEEYRRILSAQSQMYSQYRPFLDNRQMFTNKKNLSEIPDAEFEVIEPKQLRESALKK